MSMNYWLFSGRTPRQAWRTTRRGGVEEHESNQGQLNPTGEGWEFGKFGQFRGVGWGGEADQDQVAVAIGFWWFGRCADGEESEVADELCCGEEARWGGGGPSAEDGGVAVWGEFDDGSEIWEAEWGEDGHFLWKWQYSKVNIERKLKQVWNRSTKSLEWTRTKFSTLTVRYL